MITSRQTLNPAMPVLQRPDGTVQLGWDPRRAIGIRPPDGLTVGDLADLLRGMQSGVDAESSQALALAAGLTDVDGWTGLVDALNSAGLLQTAPDTGRRPVSVRIHGSGPLSDLLAGALNCSGTRVRTSRFSHVAVTRDAADLVVLSDFLVADRRLVRDLHRAGVPHLPVRIRDGTGLIGPLVLPGATSCLNCADLHRSDRDASWPVLAAQLEGTVGSGDRATVLATAAVALNQVDRVIDAIRGGGSRAEPPPTLDATLEFDIGSRTTVVRRWSRHPLCDWCDRLS
ncbi:TOMM precursor leader peptide-binding protein [Mycolicibacterium mucogenicum]|uniref:Cyclodehydratase n=1 Tax=Mycolicibacterium mucogenicum DSM 44124 TaxID=1226753 RepID=A0A8H2JF03_MYCMU|nr:TOMM precursor leader peptide-binding protein [Mycolicibacterium mucogenicum]KAB7760247.1 cyclodehydratase [Mycolicibacterium mucogenicum DSM 44124]QPG67798.1 TOMM precursor leader peptide-binding protein [Mycolicibacterium mucogenicum DSM 44124]